MTGGKEERTLGNLTEDKITNVETITDEMTTVTADEIGITIEEVIDRD